jgi:hypothetical protein
MMSKWAFILTLAAGVAGGATSASAVQFLITSDHCTGGCGTAPFGTVDVIQVGTGVQITVNLADGPPNTVGWASTGAGDFQLFKFNATGVVVGDITVQQTFAGQTLVANTGSFNGDGTGNFSFGISCSTCGNGSLAPLASNLVFSIANATIADVTVANDAGNIFVADIFSGQTGNTGPVDAVPGPALGAGLPGRVVACGGLLGLARRRRQKIA